MMRQGVFLFAFFYLSLNLYAQPAKDLSDYQSRYPGAWAVTLEEEVVMTFEIVEGEVKIYEDRYEKTFFLEDVASYWKDSELGYSSFTSLENIEANTLVPGPKKYKSVKVKEFKEKDELSSSIFHDDIKYTTFSYEGLQKGAMSEISYRTNFKEIHLLGKEYLQSYIPIEKKIFTIIADESIEMGISEFNLDLIDVDYTLSIEKGKKIYRWEVKNLKELKSESGSPGFAWYGPHVIPYVKSYSINGEKTSVLSSTADLFKWYNSIIKDLNSSEDDPKVQALVDSITAGAIDDIDKVRKVFYWTQDNIKYIAIEYGMGGFVPREAGFVCENRYGDCKDMASTITHLLSYAGIESHLTWIGTNKLPYKYSEVPTPVVDNHMIATYIDNEGNYYFLDATGRYYKFGLPSSFIQGKEALIKLSENEFEVVEVPTVSSKDNKFEEKVELVIENSMVKGRATSYIDGYHKAQYEYDTENLNKEDKLRFYKAYFSKGNNKFLPNNFSEENLYPVENPLKVSYDFTIDDYVLENGDELYVNMNLNNILEGQKIEDDRSVPIQNKFEVSYVTENSLQIPEGYEVDYIPEGLKIDNELLHYESTYEIKNDRLILYQQTNIQFLTMEKNNFELWNQNLKQVKKNQNEIVIIKQKDE